MNLLADLAALASGFSGTMGVWATDLQTGETVQFGAAYESFPSASTIKLAVLYELFRQVGTGKVDLAATWPMKAEDQVPGSGVLKDLQPGLQLPIYDLATLMMTISDNTASNLCIDIVGMDMVNQAMDDLGFSGIRLYNKFYKPHPDRPKNQAVPVQLGRLMQKIVQQEVLTPTACSSILEMMKKAQNLYSARFLPERIMLTRNDDVIEPILAAKYGAITGCRHEVGAVWKGGRGYVFSVMTRDCLDERWVEENEGQLLVGQTVAVLHQHFLGV